MIELKIEKLGMNGEGISRYNDKVCFVPFALIDEVVQAEIKCEKSKFNECDLINVLSKSKERTLPYCKYFYQCGGCNLQHLNYASQLKFKTNLVKETLQKVGQIDYSVADCVGGDEAFHYRNKAVFPYGKMVGMFKSSSHEIIDIDYCPLMNDNINVVLNIFKDFCKKYSIKGYDFEKNYGLIKFLVVRSVNDKTLVCLVATKDDIPNLDKFYEMLKDKLENIGLYVNVNKQKNSVILGKDFVYKYGIKNIDLNEFKIQYSIDVASFLQVNNDIKNKIYTQVLQEIEKGDLVVDAYAGAGLLSAIISTKASDVKSVEIVKQASNEAQKLVEKNNIKNMEVINGDCTYLVPKIVDKLKKNKLKNRLVVVLDPAHNGCAESVINAVKDVDKIIYISCNPITLAKELKSLTKYFKIKSITPYDMFPQTKHVETLCVLEK